MRFMRIRHWIFLFLWWCALPLCSQTIVTVFDDVQMSVTTVMFDTVQDAGRVDSLPAQDVVMVQDTVVAQEAIVQFDTIAEQAVPTELVVQPIHWRDMRSTRDSIRHYLRGSRQRMRADIRTMRDSVRANIYDNIHNHPHALRIGWGDQLFESLAWHETYYPTILPQDYTATYQENYRYLQHIFAEYMYDVSYGYGIGLLVDYSGVMWDDVVRNGQGQELNRVLDRAFHNIVLMPQVRFSYYHTEYVSLYSALGVGVNINTGTERDYKGRTTAVAPAVNISLLGLRVGNNRVFAAVELGGMISLMSTNEVYMLGSRIFTASIGFRL